jgi:hypothetical protein
VPRLTTSLLDGSIDQPRSRLAEMIPIPLLGTTLVNAISIRRELGNHSPEVVPNAPPHNLQQTDDQHNDTVVHPDGDLKALNGLEEGQPEQDVHTLQNMHVSNFKSILQVSLNGGRITLKVTQG